MNNEPVAWMMKAREPSLHSPDYITFEKPTRDMKISHQPTPLYTHPVKELTREDRLKLIGTLKWAEDLLRVAGHDEAVNDVQDCIMLLRKAQE